jgi:hypothetical protein
VILGNEEPMSKIRGKWFTYKDTDISIMPIFHPSYLLRSPSKEKGAPKWLTWQDMIEVKNALDCVKKVKELESRPPLPQGEGLGVRAGKKPPSPSSRWT